MLGGTAPVAVAEGTYVGGGVVVEKTCRGVAFGGGDVKVGALALGGPMPVAQFVLSFGGGPWRPVVSLGCGA